MIRSKVKIDYHLNLQKRKYNKTVTNIKRFVSRSFTTKNIRIFNFIVALLMVLISSFYYFKIIMDQRKKNTNLLRTINKEYMPYLNTLHKIVKRNGWYVYVPQIASTYHTYSACEKKSGSTKLAMFVGATVLFMTSYDTPNSFFPQLTQKFASEIFEKQRLAQLANWDDSMVGLGSQFLQSIAGGKAVNPYSTDVADQIRKTVFLPITNILLGIMAQGGITIHDTTKEGWTFLMYMVNSSYEKTNTQRIKKN